MALSLSLWAEYTEGHRKLQWKSESIVEEKLIMGFDHDSDDDEVHAVVKASSMDGSYKVHIALHDLDDSSCECPVKARCKHVAAVLLHGSQNVSKTDVPNSRLEHSYARQQTTCTVEESFPASKTENRMATELLINEQQLSEKNRQGEREQQRALTIKTEGRSADTEDAREDDRLNIHQPLEDSQPAATGPESLKRLDVDEEYFPIRYSCMKDEQAEAGDDGSHGLHAERIMAAPQDKVGEKRKKSQNSTSGRRSKVGRMDSQEWGSIQSIEDLKAIDNFISMESRLAPRRSKKESTKLVRVSGEMLVEWASPPERMPLLAIQEALRMGNSNSNLKELQRIVNLIQENNPPRKRPNLSYFTKLHPEDVEGLAQSLELQSVLAIPASLKDECRKNVPGDSEKEKKDNINNTLKIVENAIDLIEETDLDKLTHGGMALIRASWAVIKTVLR